MTKVKQNFQIELDHFELLNSINSLSHIIHDLTDCYPVPIADREHLSILTNLQRKLTRPLCEIVEILDHVIS